MGQRAEGEEGWTKGGGKGEKGALVSFQRKKEKKRREGKGMQSHLIRSALC